MRIYTRFGELREKLVDENNRLVKVLDSSSSGETTKHRALDRMATRVTSISLTLESLNVPPSMEAIKQLFSDVLELAGEGVRKLSIGLSSGSSTRYEDGRLTLNEAATKGNVLRSRFAALNTYCV